MESETFQLLWHTVCIRIVFSFSCISIFTEHHCASHVYEIPCKAQEDKSLYLSLKGNEIRCVKKEKPQQPICCLFASLFAGQSGQSASFLLWGLYCLVLYFFRLKLKIVLKYTSNPRMCSLFFRLDFMPSQLFRRFSDVIIQTLQVVAK